MHRRRNRPCAHPGNSRATRKQREPGRSSSGGAPSRPLLRGSILRSLVCAPPSCRAVGNLPPPGSSWAQARVSLSPAKDPELRALSSRPWVEGSKEKAKCTGAGVTISSAPRGSECKFTRDPQWRFIIPHIIKTPPHPRLRPSMTGFLPASRGGREPGE